MTSNLDNVLEPVPNEKPVPKTKPIQLLIGLGFGIVFGFLLQRSGVANCDVIIGQLLLEDFTVLKVMLSAVITGLFVVNFIFSRNLAEPQPKPGGWGKIVPGSIVFGIGFAVLGYCPGTLPAAVGQGSMDALFAGLLGIMAGSWFFTLIYTSLKPVLKFGEWKSTTVPELLGANRWLVIVSLAFVLTLILLILEVSGL